MDGVADNLAEPFINLSARDDGGASTPEFIRQ